MMQKDDPVAKLQPLLLQPMKAHHAKDMEKLSALKLQENHLLSTLTLDQKYQYNLLLLCNVFGSTPDEFDLGVAELCGTDNVAAKNQYVEENIIGGLKGLGEISYKMAMDM